MSEIIDLTKWLKAQTDKFETKKRLLLFTDIIHTPSGEKVKEGFRYFHADADELLAAFDADDVEAITRLPYALDAEGEIDTSGLCLKLAYTPGSAFLAAQLFLGKDFNHIVVPFDEIFDAVREGKADAGLIIHEGQLTYGNEGFKLVHDLGEWWKRTRNGLPLPLGGNVVRKDIKAQQQKKS